MSFELVETVEVGSGGATSIEFTSIPQDGTDLVLKLSSRGSTQVNIFVQVNGDTGANYNEVKLQGSGSSASSSSDTGDNEWNTGFQPRNTDTANTFGSMELYFSNYTSSSAKSISGDSVSENNGTAAYQHIMALSYDGTSPITSILLFNFDVSVFEQYSSASLYKITAA